jgi:hypothetical protein
VFAPELRRRGDTLVRSRDLSVVIEAADEGRVVTDREALDGALQRLDGALGRAL